MFPNKIFYTPIAIIVFNRPDLTQRMIERLSNLRLDKLYVIMDGPRKDNQKDLKAREEILKILECITFANKVIYNVSEVNLGCKTRVISGLDWLFDKEEMAIILEDDCLPSLSFFEFCENNLKLYENDLRVGIISGTNFYPEIFLDNTYFFSKYANIWGWASWRRTWKNYDEQLLLWNDKKFKIDFKSKCASTNEYKYWNAVFTQTKLGQIDTWDYQLWLSIWAQNQISVVPCVNLIDNLGFQHPEATHTSGRHPAEDAKANEITFPLVSPNNFIPNSTYDLFIRNLLYKYPSFAMRILNKIRFLYMNYIKN